MMYIISMGSNLGESEKIMRGALKALETSPLWTTTGKSSFYRTVPWGKKDQPDFLNAVVAGRWENTPEKLLQLLQKIELRFGRIRKIHWGPRTLDLDLIYGDEVVKNTQFLKLPHPFFWDRPFVLVPLEEIFPQFVFKNQKIHDRIKELQGYDEVSKEIISWEGGL